MGRKVYMLGMRRLLTYGRHSGHTHRFCVQHTLGVKHTFCFFCGGGGEGL